MRSQYKIQAKSVSKRKLVLYLGMRHAKLTAKHNDLIQIFIILHVGLTWRAYLFKCYRITLLFQKFIIE